MKRLRNILTVILLALGMLLPATVRAENTVDVKEIVFGRSEEHTSELQSH